MAFFSFLLSRLGIARAQGERFATIEQLREAVMDAMRKRYPGATVLPNADDPATFSTVTASDPATPHTSDITNLYNRIRNGGEDPDELIEQFIAWLPDALAPFDIGKHLVVVPRVADYANHAISRIVEPFVGDLNLVYMADLPSSLRTVTQEELEGVTMPEAKEIALGNVRKWLPQVGSDHQFGEIVLYFVDANTMMAPSLILLDEFWDSVKERFPGDALIAIPRRDQLFIGDPTDKGRLMARRLIEITFADDFALLSDQLYARRKGKIVVEEN